MARSTEGSRPDVTHVDLSAELPGPKAHRNPLQPAKADVLRGRLQVRNFVISGSAEVNRGVHRAVEFAVVCLIALVAAAVAVALCYVSSATGPATLLVAIGTGAVVLTLGLVRTSIRRSDR